MNKICGNVTVTYVKFVTFLVLTGFVKWQCYVKVQC